MAGALCVFDLIYEIILSNSINPSRLFIDPFYNLWFLGVLVPARILTPVFDKLKISTVAIPFFLLLSILSHFELAETMWTSSNIIKYIPYFLIGVWFKKMQWDISKISYSLIVKVLAIAGILSTAYFFYVIKIDYEEVIAVPEWINPIDKMGLHLIINKYDPWWKSVLVDFSYRALSAIVAILFFTLIPKKEFFLTKHGKYTLGPYLLHPFIMYALDKYGKVYEYNGAIWIAFLVLVSACISIAFSSPIIFNKLKFVLSPKFSWAYVNK